MSVPLANHLHQLSTYITGTVKRNRKLLPQQFINKFAVGQKKHCRFGPLLTCVFCENKSQKKVLSFFSPATPQLKKRKYRKHIDDIHK
jgi:hypothetical protein